MTHLTSSIGRWFGLAAAGIGLISTPVAATQTPQERRNVALVERGFDDWRNGTGSPYDLLAEDVSWTITGNSVAAKTYPSKEAFLSEVIRPFNARMGQRLIPSIHHVYADGDTVVVLFDARGIATDGQYYVNSYAWFLRLKDRRIIEARAFFDSMAFDDLWRRVAPAELG